MAECLRQQCGSQMIVGTQRMRMNKNKEYNKNTNNKKRYKRHFYNNSIKKKFFNRFD